MILADTSVWADHLGKGDAAMASLLEQDEIAMHPYVLGELAMGSMGARQSILGSLFKLVQMPMAEPAELLRFVDRHVLYGIGVGYIDAHLLASTMLADRTTLWTRDKRLRAAAERLGVAADVR